MGCEFLEKCIFFNDKMINMPIMTNIYKKKYCHEDNNSCARYIIKKSQKDVPSDLLPNQIDRAKELIFS